MRPTREQALAARAIVEEWMGESMPETQALRFVDFATGQAAPSVDLPWFINRREA